MSIQPEIPELTDEQVDRMYRRVTGRIDLDASVVRTKRRKLVLAAASVVAVVGLGVGALAGGVAVLSDNSSMDMLSVPEAEERALTDGAVEGDAGAGTGDAVQGVREIVTTASAHLATDDPEAAADDLARWTEDQRGRVESRSESSEDDGTTIDLRVRVPAGSTGDTTQRLRELGEVSSLTIDTEDVSAQGRDLDARIKALEISVARLQDLMTKASTTADLLAAEQTLSQRQSDLEALQAERRGLSDQVAMATYSVVISSEDEPEAPSGSGFVGALASGWDAMVAVLAVALRVVGFLLPWAALLAVLAAAYLAGRRLLRR
ncbi:DUF4349 domain-containing protein [Mumia zhuanghuii]|uniref:DUF4349 domain-containing protein n=1 Tax=Mumia zhuanghuii TaxID=2585211 RepID=A0A5C4MHS1_9ACTN|nr:DUF4349 domain-containing protein [Mumia zhuanghuii]TNC43094.1 DUF4349 domain-containing protein [Mumia zhuanghuii]TNC46039.1 DUF4349 domain-containing protein [Mumia zhuanghuii]